jgi:type VI protein secretion system component VasK
MSKAWGLVLVSFVVVAVFVLAGIFLLKGVDPAQQGAIMLQAFTFAGVVLAFVTQYVMRAQSTAEHVETKKLVESGTAKAEVAAVEAKNEAKKSAVAVVDAHSDLKEIKKAMNGMITGNKS